MRSTLKTLFLLLMALIVLVPMTATANEFPPGANILQTFFGGKVFYTESGISFGLEYQKNPTIDSSGKWYIYDPSKPVSLDKGDKLKFTIVVETGLENQSKLRTKLEIFNQQSGKMEPIGNEINGTAGVIEFTNPEHAKGFMPVRIYCDTNERKVVNSYTGAFLYVNPNRGLPPAVANSTTTDQTVAQVISTNTGSVKIYFYKDLQLGTSANNFLITELKIYSNGQLVGTPLYNVSGYCEFRGVPPGVITIVLKPCDWVLGSGNWYYDEGTKKYSWKLDPNGSVTINLVKGGK